MTIRRTFLLACLAAALLCASPVLPAGAARIDWFLQPVWERASRFSEGLAAVRSGGYWGYIEPGGRWVVGPTLSDAHPFREGAAAVSVRGRWGFVDRKGKFIIPPAFEAAGAFCEELAAVRSADKWGYIKAS